MGKTGSKGHEEYSRDDIKCRGYVEKYSFKRGAFKRLYFILKDSQLSYSKNKDLPPTRTTLIDKTFKLLFEDLDKKEINIECTVKGGETSLWKLVFSNKENTRKWADKIRKAIRPVWENPDSTTCSICDKPFQLLRRQHHCRKCGRVMCGDHTKIIPSLPDLGYYSKVKICANCINRIGNLDGVQRAKSLTNKEIERKSILKSGSVVLFTSSMIEN